MPRGRVVGGSSATNGAIALRGHPEHYDEWGRFVDGYGWASWLPWFRRIERDLDFGAAPHHGDAGPIAISRYRPPFDPVQEAFREAALACGHAEVADHNRPGAIGIGPVPLNMVGGVRQTPADHYLAPALGRPNLRVVPLTLVDRVELAGGRARAVLTLGPHGPERLAADVVVVALGTYATAAARSEGSRNQPISMRGWREGSVPCRRIVPRRLRASATWMFRSVKGWPPPRSPE